MTWNNLPLRINILETSVRTENIEEVPSEGTVQYCSFQPVNQRMYHVAK